MGAPRINSAQSLLQQSNTFTQPQKLPDGDATSPALAFATAANSGLYNVGGVPCVTQGGVQRLFIGSTLRFAGAGAAAPYNVTGSITTVTSAGVLAKNTVKAWGCITISGGVPTLADSWNISSITDLGVGRAQPNFANAMTNANYCVIATVKKVTATNGETVTVTARGTSSFELNTQEYSGGLKDLSEIHFVVLGL